MWEIIIILKKNPSDKEQIKAHYMTCQEDAWNQHLREDTRSLTRSRCAPSQVSSDSLWTSKVPRGECSDNRVNLCGENDQRPLCVANPISSSLDTCKQPKSNMLFHTHSWWDIPLTRPQHQIIRLKGKTWIYTVWRQCLEVFFHPDKNQSQALTLLSPQFPEALHGKAAGRAAAEGRGGPPDPLGEFGLF